MMDFIFNINTEPETANKQKDIEDILSDIETHFEDWSNFYNLYQMFAPPPTENSKQIQHWFKELQASFFKIITKYNNKINKFADIQEIEEGEIQDMVKGVMSKMNKDSKSDKKEKNNNGSEMMWG